MDFEILIGIFPQVLIDGITLGFMYALIALGYTMVYGVLEFINFAHSEIFIIGAFVGVEILLSLKAAGWLDVLPWALVLLIILVAGMLVSGVVAVVIERTAYRPLRHAPRLIPLTFLIGGAMGGGAGVLFGVQYSLINPYTGFIPGLKAFTAAVLGGIGNVPGAMLGGLVLGLLEAFAASYLSLLTGGAFGAEYKDILAFSILILILIFRPKGLLGEIVRERA